MATTFAPLQALKSARLRSLIWPREHGVWGILFVPLITGGCVGLLYGQRVGLLALFIVTAAAHFWLRTPFEVWVESTPLRARTDEERQAVLLSMLVYATIGDVALVLLLILGHTYGLLALGAVAVVMFFAQPLFREKGRHMRLAAELIGCVGLTSAASGAYYVTTGHFDSTAFTLWAISLLFVVNQVHFVHLRIHTARAADRTVRFAHGQQFLFGELVTVLLLALGWRAGLLPGLTTFAFAPILLRGVIWFLRKPSPLDVHRLGVSELLHAALFGLLVTLSFVAAYLQG
jgi:hypothetical protein